MMKKKQLRCLSIILSFCLLLVSFLPNVVFAEVMTYTFSITGADSLNSDEYRCSGGTYKVNAASANISLTSIDSINESDEISFIATPDSNYVPVLLVDGVVQAQEATNEYHIVADKNKSIELKFAPSQYTLTFDDVSSIDGNTLNYTNGKVYISAPYSITWNSSNEIKNADYGQKISFAFAPDAGYVAVASVGANQLAISSNTCTFTPDKTDGNQYTINISFVKMYSITICNCTLLSGSTSTVETTNGKMIISINGSSPLATNISQSGSDVVINNIEAISRVLFTSVADTNYEGTLHIDGNIMSFNSSNEFSFDTNKTTGTNYTVDVNFAVKSHNISIQMPYEVDKSSNASGDITCSIAGKQACVIKIYDNNTNQQLPVDNSSLSFNCPVGNQVRVDVVFSAGYHGSYSIDGGTLTEIIDKFTFDTDAATSKHYNLRLDISQKEDPFTLCLYDFSGNVSAYDSNFINNCSTIVFSYDNVDYHPLSDANFVEYNGYHEYSFGDHTQIYIKFTWEQGHNGPELHVTDNTSVPIPQNDVIMVLYKDNYQVQYMPFNITWTYDDANAPEDMLVMNGEVEILETSGVTIMHQDEHGGYVFAEPGTIITIRMIPDYGYQAPSSYINGNELEPVVSDRNTFTYEMPYTNIHLQGVFVKTPDEFVITNSAVSSASVDVGSSIKSGNVRVTIGELSISEEEKAAMQSAASTGVANLYVDLSVENFWLQGGTGNEWTSDVKELNSELTISVVIDQTQFTDSSNFCVVRNHNGKIEVLPAVYDSKTGTVTFSTDQFSDYAIIQLPKTVAPTPTPTPTPTPIKATVGTGELTNTNIYFSLAFLLTASATLIAMNCLRRKEND